MIPWITARLREDSTRSGIGQLAILVVLLALLCGVDVHALLTQAEASIERVGVIVASAVGVWAQLSRILTPQPPSVTPLLPEAALRGLERLGAALEQERGR